MSRIKIVAPSGNEVFSTEIPSSAAIILTPNGDELMCIFAGDDASYRVSGTYVIRQKYVEDIKKVKEAYPELFSHIGASKFLVFVDTKYEKPEVATANSDWHVELKKTPAALRGIFGKNYTLYLRQYYLDRWSPDQLYAAIMSQLLRIEEEKGVVINYTEDYMSPVAVTFGANYLDENSFVPSILDNKVELLGLPKADGKQVNIDDVIEGEAEEVGLPFDPGEDEESPGFAEGTYASEED